MASEHTSYVYLCYVWHSIWQVMQHVASSFVWIAPLLDFTVHFKPSGAFISLLVQF